MSNGDNKSECLRYPGQPDTHTRDELIEYFEALAAKAPTISAHICLGLIGEPCDICGAPDSTPLKTKVTNSGNTLYSYGGGIWFSTKEAAAIAWPIDWSTSPVSSR